MPHVARREIDPIVAKRIHAQLIEVLNRKREPKLIRELLTETEQLMLAKRLAAIFMLEEEFSYYRISYLLGLSTSTIKRLHQQLIGDDFPSLKRLVRSKKEHEAFMKTMETILRAGLPPYGKGRWQSIDDILARMKD